jgi:hypothetical protein
VAVPLINLVSAALHDTDVAATRRDLEGLYDQHLLTEPAPGRYQLHDLLREHARTLAAVGHPVDRDAATGRLLDYYLHTALAASKHIARTSWNPAAVWMDQSPPHFGEVAGDRARLAVCLGLAEQDLREEDTQVVSTVPVTCWSALVGIR